MENDAATLYCPNENCQALNPLTHNFCQRCSTPLPKRFLWAVTDGLNLGQRGDILDDRYLVINRSIVLDTKPGYLPQTPDPDKLHAIRPYLRLFSYRLHIPQVYGILPLFDGQQEREILLLEKSPIKITDVTALSEVDLYSEFTSAWCNATSMRQLNWLWQIAHLWQPLASEGVGSSLLNSQLLRVEGSLIRLLELPSPQDFVPSLSELGEFWQQLQPGAKSAIAEFVSEICHYLINKDIQAPEQLIRVLDKGLAELGQAQSPKITIATKSDTGPSRQRNEDACYPQSGSIITKPPHSCALTIVCDGIGGHEGGNVASNLAIDTIQHQVQELTKVPYDHIDPILLLEDLQRAAAVANDKISQRNDSESRQGRQRMGTTLVMALPVGHEIYIAHVGDSRAYWITPYGCYQVTLDDDVASREVRLGYAIYRDAVQQGASGSLVQALGMSPSSSLHPSAERFLVDEDCIFLLCSDGLSDFDRVEQYWDTEILPLLQAKTDIASITERLIEIANTVNGHDNVTVSLVHYQVQYSEPETKLAKVLPEFFSISAVTKASSPTLQIKPEGFSYNQKTQVIPDTAPSKRSQVPLQLVIISVLVLLGGFVGYLLRQGGYLKGKVPDSPPITSTIPPVTVTSPPPVASDRAALIQTANEISFTTIDSSSKSVIVPAGSVLQILNDIQQTNPKSWVYLRVCSVGEGVTLSTNPSNPLSTPIAKKPMVKQGQEVRIQLAEFNLLPNISTPAPKINQCLASNTAVTAGEEPSSVESTPTLKPENKVPTSRY
ncbi:protein phosphatase 2C domain-containing protein [Chlorogloeopsis sp. ULAP01]|uniref:PP2C family protein-serine/threonine phosphatase n=1 Tax=Chlorogloeopsis sp. ULAP01 TaxID=3056483 RepID=UPI0025AA98AC|nr:protein phosphatase 2C domain-containing protein [Chlorogloeopsis sp. ULAP01]MDM9383324.1 protein phosphatase 2C domain-containing protein [Chlorogloeopsis sp. ULAP01]